MVGFRKREVEQLLKTHGQEVQYYLGDPSSTYDPTTGTNTSTDSTPITVLGYFYNYSLEEMNGNSVARGDRKLLLSTTDINGGTLPEPTTESSFQGVGDSVEVASVDKIYSGGSVMCYICHVRE